MLCKLCYDGGAVFVWLDFCCVHVYIDVIRTEAFWTWQCCIRGGAYLVLCACCWGRVEEVAVMVVVVLAVYICFASSETGGREGLDLVFVGREKR